MRESNKAEWLSMQLKQFASPEDAWAYYKDKGTPEELAKLKVLLDQARFIKRQRQVANLRKRCA